MAQSYGHLSESCITVASCALLNHGVHLHCLDCGRVRTWTPAALAAEEAPARRIWDFKRRRRCRCGAHGSSDRVELRIFVVGTYMANWRRPPGPTAPQLWAS